MSATRENPPREMQGLMHVIAGARVGKETGEQLRAKVARRLNSVLPADRQISPSRAKRYWYAEIDDIPSDHMDAARRLARVQPIKGMEDAAEAMAVRLEEVLDGIRERLALAASLSGAAHRLGLLREPLILPEVAAPAPRDEVKIL